MTDPRHVVSRTHAPGFVDLIYEVHATRAILDCSLQRKIKAQSSRKLQLFSVASVNNKRIWPLRVDVNPLSLEPANGP